MNLLNLAIPGEKSKRVPIFTTKNLLAKLPVLLKSKKFGFEYVIVTDEKVKKLLGLKLYENLKKAGVKVSLISVPPGERTKNLLTAKNILEKMVSLKLKRDSCIIALGGGVIGDLASFVASIFMRGISLVHIPTTLLSMIDSCIGGKTGVDLEAGKNLVGTFYQPKAIFIDPALLATLSLSEFRNGLAEMVKHAVIASPKLFHFLENNFKKIEPSASALLEKLIHENVKIKMKIAGEDPEEDLRHVRKGSSRMFLNYGHTIGHAIEKVSNYEIPHGEAISIGMCLENIIAVKKGFLKAPTAVRIRELLKSFGLPTKLPSSVSLTSIDRALKMDKKSVGGKLYFALPTKIGSLRLFAL